MLSPCWLFFLHHGIASDVVAGQVTAAGFALERRVDGWSPIDYCLMFRKPWASRHTTAAEEKRKSRQRAQAPVEAPTREMP